MEKVPPKLQPLSEIVTGYDEAAAWCSGIWNVSPTNMKIFYEAGGTTEVINLANATAGELDALALACTKSTGAGKVDFAIPGGYGADEQNKFGTCVVILPTLLHRGTLLLRNTNHELIVDPEKMLQGKEIGHISYAAFRKDSRLEVKNEAEGYCVIITYNLYLSDGDQTSRAENLSTESFVTALSKLLEDPNYLPKGGYLGFGLQYEYSLKRKEGDKSDKDEQEEYDKMDGARPCVYGRRFNFIKDHFQRSDAVVLRGLTELGLSQPSIKIIYSYSDRSIMSEVEFDPESTCYDPLADIVQTTGGEIIEDLDSPWHETAKVHWVTLPTTQNTVHSMLATNYHKHNMVDLEGLLVLVAPIGVPGMRHDIKSIIPYDPDVDMEDVDETNSD
ncbi:hypothetical protein BD410DRAFT_799148 [Rickenella mellea]|uniref:Uncharacterized protein n=1 Tax=Rickenella mellea TaxID=50990 RepID=A0A4Y7QKX0_9AGAM|nr:hypothetical protein BD410DRAFT_799148 [Rickenella mellea]